MGIHLRYSWQRLVLYAFLEVHFELLPTKIELAEEAILQRLREKPGSDERLALVDALASLRTLMPQEKFRRFTPQKNIA